MKHLKLLSLLCLLCLLLTACSPAPPAEITTEPATTEPITTEPITTEPATTEPTTTEPITTEPATTEEPAPEVTEPATTEPIPPEPVMLEGFLGSYEALDLNTYPLISHEYRVFGDQLMTASPTDWGFNYCFYTRDESGRPVPDPERTGYFELGGYGRFMGIRPLDEETFLLKATGYALKLDRDMKVVGSMPMPTCATLDRRTWREIDPTYEVTDDLSYVFYASEQGIHMAPMKPGAESTLLVEHGCLDINPDNTGFTDSYLAYRVGRVHNGGAQLSLYLQGYDSVENLFILDLPTLLNEGTIEGRWLFEEVISRDTMYFLTDDRVFIHFRGHEYDPEHGAMMNLNRSYDIATGEEVFSLWGPDWGGWGYYTGKALVIPAFWPEDPAYVGFQHYDINTGETTLYDFAVDDDFPQVCYVWDNGDMLVMVGDGVFLVRK